MAGVTGAVTGQAVPSPRAASALQLLAQAGPSRVDGSDPAHLLLALAANPAVEQQQRTDASRYCLLVALMVIAVAVAAYDVLAFYAG